MSRKIQIPIDMLRRVLRESDGYILRAARRLKLDRLTVLRRITDAGLVDEARRLRRSAKALKPQVTKYRPNATPTERLRWLDGINRLALDRKQRNRINCARWYWRQRVKSA